MVNVSATRIGEVIEASTREFVAQCYELHQPPPFGCLVKAGSGEGEIYGLAYESATTSIDPGRKPIARGLEEDSEEDLYRHHPQLLQLLRTEVRALVVGYHSSEEGLRQGLPPWPARIHAFAYRCHEAETCAFTMGLDFLSLVAEEKIPAGDELLAACIRLASRAHPDPQAFLLRGGKRLAGLLGRDIQRLTTILRKLS